jgi:putative addiction module killer protein
MAQSCSTERGQVIANPRELRLYRTSSGKVPFEDWMDGLRDGRGRAQIEVRLDRLELGVLELRIDFGPGYRVYFAEDGPVVVLLLIGGDKSTQRKDIKTAKAYWKDYREGQDERTLEKL